VIARAVGDFNAAQHACEFFDPFILIKVRYARPRGFPITEFANAELLMSFARDLR